MNVVYNSSHYSVLEYPRRGFELIDKDTGCGAFIQGEVAAKFRDSIDHVIARQPDEEVIDDFLESYQDWMTQRLRFH
jgi:hypothetical protein